MCLGTICFMGEWVTLFLFLCVCVCLCFHLAGLCEDVHCSSCTDVYFTLLTSSAMCARLRVCVCVHTRVCVCIFECERERDRPWPEVISASGGCSSSVLEHDPLCL